MNRFTNYIGSDKRELLPVAAYYLVLLLIAMSWTERALVEPKTIFRLLFTVLFALPMFKYQRLAPAILAIFLIIRLFSVSPFGYLPSDQKFSFYLILVLFIFEIIPRIHAGNGKLLLKGSSKGLVTLFFIVLLSNAVNLNSDYSLLLLLAATMMLTRFIRSRDEIQLLEIAFIIITFCLSIYAFIFRDDFAIKLYLTKGVIQRSYWTDPNYLGSMLSIGIVVSFYYYMNRVNDKLIFRIFYLVVFIMGYLILGLLASRGAFLAAIVPTIYILYKKTNSIKNLVFVVLFVGLIFAAFSSSDYFGGLIARFDSGDTTGSNRTIIWDASFRLFLKADMPMLLIGGGTNSCNEFCAKALGMSTVASPHNNFLAILYDYGIIGLIVFLSMLYSWITKNANNVLAVSLVLYLALVCFTLVPLMDYSYSFLLVLFEKYRSSSNVRTKQLKNSRFIVQNQWRVKRLNPLTRPKSMRV